MLQALSGKIPVEIEIAPAIFGILHKCRRHARLCQLKQGAVLFLVELERHERVVLVWPTLVAPVHYQLLVRDLFYSPIVFNNITHAQTNKQTKINNATILNTQTRPKQR